MSGRKSVAIAHATGAAIHRASSARWIATSANAVARFVSSGSHAGERAPPSAIAAKRVHAPNAPMRGRAIRHAAAACAVHPTHPSAVIAAGTRDAPAIASTIAESRHSPGDVDPITRSPGLNTSPAPRARFAP